MRLDAETALTLGMAVLIFATATARPARAGSPERSLSENLSQLNSDQWENRYNSYKHLASDPNALSNADVRSALVELLGKENHVVESVVATTHQGTDEKYGEGYSEYIAQLLGTVAVIADWDSPREVCVIAHGSYDPESPLARKLAQRSALIVPCIMQMVGSPFSVYRYQAAPILVDILASRSNHLAAGVLRDARHAIVTALDDNDSSVRQATVEALGRSGSTDMIPSLEILAHSDAASYRTAGGKRSFPVREAAIRAISSIRGRGTTPTAAPNRQSPK